MINLEQTVVMKWNVANRDWYIAKGYEYTRCTDEFTVKVADLPKKSKAKVSVTCDFCGCTVIKTFANYNIAIEKHSDYMTGDACSDCRGKKTQIANRTPFDIVKKAFEDIGLTLQTEDYKDGSEPMPCICNNHKDKGVQYIAYSELRGRKHGCAFCYREARNVKEYIKVDTEEFLVTKTAKVRWNNQNKDHYTSLGYVFTKVGDSLTVKTSDLTIGSPIIVECECSKCGSVSSIEYRKLVENVQRNGYYKCGGCPWYTQEEVKTMFTDAGYELLSEYTNSIDKLQFICPVHGIMDISFSNFSQGRRCRKCGTDKIRVPYEDVKKAFDDRGYTLISKEYIDNKQLLEYSCDKHPNEISKIKYNDIQQGHGCPHCKNDATSERQSGEGSFHWKGGISSLNSYLRTCINIWKTDSMKSNGFKCVITGENFDAVHHLTSFAFIVQEMLSELNMDVREQVSMYTGDELEIMSNRIVAKHYEYGLGICLCDRVHKLFHKLYGKETVKPEQFNEFKVRWEAGEFNGYS